LTTKCTALGHNASGLRVVDVMQPAVYACDSDDDVEDAGRKMIEQHVAQLVVRSDSKAVGILSLADVARATDDAQLVRDIVVSVS
jgi:CBS domain-containing protein